MLTEEEIIQIKQKMKRLHISGATLGVKFGVSRQQIWCVLNGKCTSKNMAKNLREWLNESSN